MQGRQNITFFMTLKATSCSGVWIVIKYAARQSRPVELIHAKHVKSYWTSVTKFSKKVQWGNLLQFSQYYEQWEPVESNISKHWSEQLKLLPITAFWHDFPVFSHFGVQIPGPSMIEYFSAGKFYFCQIQSMLIFRSFSVGGFLVVSFFLLFFCQSTDLIVYVPLFSTDFTRFTANPAVTDSSPCFSQKLFRAFAKADQTEGSPLSIFFGTMRLFFHFFSVLPSKGPFNFFDSFAAN